MSGLDYRLCVLTHGDGATLPATLDSFREHVTPRPVDVVIHSDGSDAGRRASAEAARLGAPVMWSEAFATRGFCRATRELWVEATAGRTEYVFWLEHDFEFLRPVDLRELAMVLEGGWSATRLAQVALMRDAVSEQERAAGGLYELRAGQYDRRSAWFDRFKGDPGDMRTPHQMYEAPWLEHGSYFTTNPSLMTRQFMAQNPWPDYPEQCEGRYGIDLVARGYRFAAWGDGTPWVAHTGHRMGHGY